MAENPSITVAIVTVTGEAMKLEPGTTYVIEMSQHTTPQVIDSLRKWGDEHGIKFLVFGPGVKILRETETGA